MKIQEAVPAVDAQEARVVLGKRELAVLEKARDVLGDLPNGVGRNAYGNLDSFLIAHNANGFVSFTNGREDGSAQKTD